MKIIGGIESARMMKRLAPSVLALFVLAGCGGFLGANNEKPLPGERISILVLQSALEPDVDESESEILLPAPTANPDWPQPGGYANHAMQHISVGDNLVRAWRSSIGAGSSDDELITSQPIVAGGRIFALDSGSSVTAFDTRDGGRIWRSDLTPKEEDDGHIGGGLAYEDGRIFVATGFGEIIALEAETGKTVWRRRFSASFRAAPTVRAGRIFVINVINQLQVLATDDGRTMWTHAGIEETASLLGGSSPAVDGDVVVVPYSSGELFALRVENGRELWSASLVRVRRASSVTTLSHIRGRPIIDRGVVIAVSNGGLMAAIDLRTGRRIWEREIASAESPWVVGDFIYTLTTNAELVALGRTNGRIYWVRPLAQFKNAKNRTGRIVWTGPILVSDRLIVAGSTGEALTVSPYTGEIMGKVDLPDGVTVPPVAAAESIYFLSDDADLIAYR